MWDWLHLPPPCSLGFDFVYPLNFDRRLTKAPWRSVEWEKFVFVCGSISDARTVRAYAALTLLSSGLRKNRAIFGWQATQHDSSMILPEQRIALSASEFVCIHRLDKPFDVEFEGQKGLSCSPDFDCQNSLTIPWSIFDSFMPQFHQVTSFQWLNLLAKHSRAKISIKLPQSPSFQRESHQAQQTLQRVWRGIR